MQTKLLIIICIALLTAMAQSSHAQKNKQAMIDSMVAELSKAKEDTGKVKQLINLSLYNDQHPDEGIHYGEMGMALAEKLGWKAGIAIAYNAVAWNYMDKKIYNKAGEYFQNALRIGEELNDKKIVAKNLSNLGDAYNYMGDNVKALDFYSRSQKVYYALGNKDRSARLLSLIGNSYNDISNYSMALEYYLKALRVYQETNDNRGVAYAFGDLGNNYFSLKEYQKALEYYQKALQINKEVGDKEVSALNIGAIGMVYSSMNRHAEALDFKMNALQLYQEIGNKMGTAVTLGNIGNEYTHLGNYSKALEYHLRALALNQESDYQFGIGNNLGDIGEMYKKAAESRSSYLDSINLTRTAVLQKAEEYVTKSIAIFKKTGELSHLDTNLSTLSRIQQLQGKDAAALETYREHILYKDSIFNDGNRKELARRELQYEYDKREDSLSYQQQLTEGKLRQQTLLSMQQRQSLLLNRQQLVLLAREKDLQDVNYLKTQASLEAEKNKSRANEQQLKASQKEQALAHATLNLQKLELQARQSQSVYLLTGIAALLVISFFITRNYVNQRRSNKVISAEKSRSDSLLLNILPADVAEELKEKGTADARLFDHVTVLFTDFVNFTTISELLTPQELVDELHTCFKAFDEVIGRYSIEKIKTIGDAYLAVAGLPNADAQHAANTVRAALEIRQYIHHRKLQMGSRSFDIRIGIHSGSVVAGIVGVKKFAYDIWGDTVNTAARMEQHSLPGQINLSEKTYELVKDQFAFTYRGEIEAKNKGALKMYFVEKQSASMQVSS